MNKNSKASSIKQISKRFTTGNMKHLLADFAIIFLLIFFPVVGAPLVFFRRKEWWAKRWVKIVTIVWLILFCILMANTPKKSEDFSNVENMNTTDVEQPEDSQPEKTNDDTPAAEDKTPQPESTEETKPATVKEVSEPTAPVQASSSEQSASSYSPNSGVDHEVGGYCNDGTYVTGNPSAKGKTNACYGHRGWRDY